MMSTNNNEPDDDTMVCFVGVAEVDDIKLKKCPTCDLVRYCSDNCRWNIRHNMKQCAKDGCLNYVTRFYLGSLKALISGTARFVYCRYRLIQKNLVFTHVAAKSFATAAIKPVKKAC